jgi:nitroreductase
MTNGMTNAVIECILSRSAAKYYDPAATLSDDQIRELVRIGTTAPTSFHLQNWRFIAVRTPEAKARLRPIAWDQPATTEAAVTLGARSQGGNSFGNSRVPVDTEKVVARVAAKKVGRRKPRASA